MATKLGLNLPEDYDLVDEKLFADVSKELEVSIDKAKDYVRHFVPEISFESFIETYEGEETYFDSNLVISEEELKDWVNQKLVKESLESILHTLTPREEHTIRMRLGFVDGKTRTLEEVAIKFDITRERIRQIEARALRKLRHPSRSRSLKGYL
jgi:RNA polymerase primary sigma factor